MHLPEKFFCVTRKTFAKKIAFFYPSALVVLFVCIQFQGQAQNPVINTVLKGSVTDVETNLPLVGVSVQIKGITNGTTTDSTGAFKLLTAQKIPLTLSVNYVGYENKEVLVTDDNVRIQLKESVNHLQDVVAVGYGTQKRSDLTGAVASIPKQALKQQVSSFERFLQGSVSGVQVTQVSGQPGSPVSIRIRGGNSITAGNEPLYVIDGFPIYNSNADASAGVASGPGINALAALNSSDIESIDILKDASATAIYGSRGANGVVVITTKKGKSGSNSISYDGSYGFQQVSKKVDVLTDGQQWGLLKNDARVNAGKSAYYSEAQIDSLAGTGTDWQSPAFRNAPMQNHQLTFLGGDNTTHYAISGNYFKQDGILLNTDFQRFSGRISVDRQVFPNFKVGANVTASKTESQIADNNIVSSLLLMPPTVPIKDANGNYTYQSAFETPLGNPIATLLYITNQSNTNRTIGNIYGEYKFLDGFVAKVSIGGDIIDNKENRYVPSTIYMGANTNSTGTASVGTKTVTTWLNENTLNYSKSFAERHSINALAGFTQQSYRSEWVTAGSQSFSNELLDYNNLAGGTIYTQPTSGSGEWALASFLARFNYSLDNKYLFTVSGRADGSSRFGGDHRWGYFPSAAFAWNAGKESFLNLPDAINNLKLRVSAGITGNQEIGIYQSLATLVPTNYYFGSTTVVGYSPNRIANPGLGWETTTQYDAGIDIALFKRFTITMDAYYKKTTDLLLNVPMPYTTGQSTSLQNYGTVENKGLEISITSQNTSGEFNWNTNLVLSFNKNKVLSLGNGVENIISGVSIAQVGEPLGSFYGFKTNGIFQTSDDISKLPVYLTKNKPGDQRYVDKDGDNIISTTGDRYVIGNAQPKLLGGLTNNFQYKNFDLTLLLQGSYGNKIFNQNMQQLEILSGQQNASVTALDRWTPENPGNVIPRAYEDPAAVASNRYVEDASYLRIKNLAIGYSFRIAPQSFKNTRLRIYCSAQNLYTWTQYSGYDPEVSRNGQNTLTQGIDYSVYPNARLFTGGINLSF